MPYLASMDASTAEDLWSLYRARHEVANAIAQLRASAAQLGPLLDDTQWDADGVRALHTMLVELSANVLREIDAVSYIDSRLARVG